MADTLDITEGTGTTIATDDIGGVHYQKIKLVDATADSTTGVYVDVGAKANALRVAPANDITDATYIGDIKFGEALATVTNITSLDKSVYVDDADWTDNTSSHTLVGGIYQSAPHTVTDGDVSPFQLDVNGKILESNSAAMAASLSILDDWDDANYCNVNLNLAGTDAGVGESALDGTELRVTIATDDDGVAHLTTIAGAVAATHMQCDIVAGTVTTVSTVTSLTQMGGVAITMGEGALDGGCQRVTLATDDDGVAHLATIAGAVAATHMQCDIIAGTVTTVSTVTNLAQLGGTAITMDEGVHDAGCQRVTLATDDDGVLSLGIIDDWDATHDSAASADGPQMMAAYDATKPAVVEDGDAVRVLADEYGRLLSGVEKTAWQEDYDSADASGEGEAVKASAASTILVVQSYVISVDAEMWVKLQEEDSSALTGKFWLKAGGGVAITLPDKAPLVLGTDSDLEVITEGAGNISVSVTGYTIPG